MHFGANDVKRVVIYRVIVFPQCYWDVRVVGVVKYERRTDGNSFSVIPIVSVYDA